MIKDDDQLLRYLDNESLFHELARSAADRIRELKIDRDAYAASARHAREQLATLEPQVRHGLVAFTQFKKSLDRLHKAARDHSNFGCCEPGCAGWQATGYTHCTCGMVDLINAVRDAGELLALSAITEKP